MFFENTFPVIRCTEIELDIREIKLSLKAKDLIAKNSQVFLGASYFDVVIAIFRKAIKVSLIAGFIESPDEDFVLFDGCPTSFLPKLRGMGRIDCCNIVTRKNKLCADDCARQIQGFIFENLDLVDSIIAHKPDDLEHSIFLKEDWLAITDPDITFDDFKKRLRSIIAIRTREFQKENLRN